MSRGLQNTLVGAILALAVGVAGLAAYVFVGPDRGASGQSEQSGSLKPSDAQDANFVILKNFVTDLADKDRNRYVDVTVALALKDEAAVKVAKKMEPAVRDAILDQLRLRQSRQLEGATGKEQLAEGIQAALAPYFGLQLQKVYITDLVVQ